MQETMDDTIANEDFQQADTYHKRIVKIEKRVPVEKEREAGYEALTPEKATPTNATIVKKQFAKADKLNAMIKWPIQLLVVPKLLGGNVTMLEKLCIKC